MSKNMHYQPEHRCPSSSKMESLPKTTKISWSISQSSFAKAKKKSNKTEHTALEELHNSMILVAMVVAETAMLEHPPLQPCWVLPAVVE